MTDGMVEPRASIIIRSSGERTEQACKNLILEQGIPAENLFVLREAPFSKALRKSLELGLERGLKWTLCNDADVLLRPAAVKTMLALAEQQEEQIFEVQGFILDKFLGGPRNGGIHLYRTSLLPKALENIQLEAGNIRPEFHTLKAMAALGHPWKTVPYLVGIHDFEQYYLDIFRKCFIHAHKHADMAELFLSFWREKAGSDRDYAVALHGFASGVEHTGDVSIDSGLDMYQALFSEYHLQEKHALDPAACSLAQVEQTIENWVEPPLYKKLYPDKFGLVSLAKGEISEKQRISQLAADLGIIKLILYAIGAALKKAGKWLQERVSPAGGS